MRLDKLLANTGIGTRSEVKGMILKGRVTVNGALIRDPGYGVNTDDDIAVNGERIDSNEYIYLLFDKPDEVLTAMEDSRLDCVGNYIPGNLKCKHLSPVGRLDYHTTGLLIITNDGTLNHKLTSPKYKVKKSYLVTYEGDDLTGDIVKELSEGITLTDMEEHTKLAPAVMELQDNKTCLITLTEGKTHEVRRIIAHYGRSVVTLRRVSIADLKLETEEPGLLRPLTKEELSYLIAAL